MLRQVDFVSERTALVQALAPVTNAQSRCLDLMARIYDDMARGNVRRYRAVLPPLLWVMCMHKECPSPHRRTCELVPAPPRIARSPPDMVETDTKEVADTEGAET